ncbi:MAG: hypothetical protein PHS95_03250 [Candidatus Pacebacteria bacterium]|nr:hypothetical protein [Candidatus Paceibacterota bacterium]
MKKLFARLSAFTILFAPLSVFAQVGNPLIFDNFSDLVAKIISTAVIVLMPFVVLAFVYAGFLFVKAQGNEEGLTHARQVIWYSIIGAFILLGAEFFSRIINNTVSSVIK